MTRLKSGLAFHCHHDILLEYVYDYDERLNFIKTEKRFVERELRKTLFVLIPEKLLPNTSQKAAYIKTGAAYYEAKVDLYEITNDKTWAAYNKAEAVYNKAEAVYKTYIDVQALHKQVCHPNCPWDGKTIFSKGTSLEVLNNE